MPAKMCCADNVYPGEYPLGNTLNVMNLTDVQSKPKILVRHLNEAIGLKIDSINQHVYLADLGGTIYRFNMDGSQKKILYHTDNAYTGVGLAHLSQE